MTEPVWKVVMDGNGLTVSGDRFSLTTHGAEPGGLDAALSELRGVTDGSHGQYCGLSRAVEAVGERWGMLVVRDLLVDDKSLAELHRGLPRLPLSLLSRRIRELAYCGVLEKAGTTDADGDDRYRLTAYGRELEDVLLALGRWGTAMLAEPRADDIVTEDSMMVAMRAAFLPEAAADRHARFELRFGDVVIHLVVEDGRLAVGRGPLPDAPVIEPGPTLKDILTGAMSVEEAMATGTVRMSGDADVLETFVSMFALPRRSAPRPAGG